MIQITWPPNPYYMRHFQIFDKIDSFLKNFLISLIGKKVGYWRTAWFKYNCWLAFFLFCDRVKKLFNLNSGLRWEAQYPRYTGYTCYFLISNCSNIFSSAVVIMQVIFWTKDNFRFIFNYRNSYNCKLKKLINEQLIIFYSPSNTPC